MGKYKDKVKQRAEEYRTKDTGFFTAKNRHNALSQLKRNEGSTHHDLAYIYKALTQALQIKQANSKFRDKVGKEALKQGVNFAAGLVELILLMLTFQALFQQDKLSAAKYGFLCFLTERFEREIECIIDQSTLSESMKKIQDEMFKTFFSASIYRKAAGDLFAFVLQQKSIYGVVANSCKIGVQSTKNIFSNVGLFCHANISYVGHSIASVFSCKSIRG